MEMFPLLCSDEGLEGTDRHVDSWFAVNFIKARKVVA